MPTLELSVRPSDFVALPKGAVLFLPMTFGRMEMEGVAAVIVAMSQEHGEWYPISWLELQQECDTRKTLFMNHGQVVLGAQLLRDSGAVEVVNVDDVDYLAPTEVFLETIARYRLTA